ncbi:hypothetical protein MishRS11D_01240 [Methylomagnum ishizawai]|nr:hypothetical protein MishRS11D_01240 [Methylomagnum ishizawai]
MIGLGIGRVERDGADHEIGQVAVDAIGQGALVVGLVDFGGGAQAVGEGAEGERARLGGLESTEGQGFAGTRSQGADGGGLVGGRAANLGFGLVGPGQQGATVGGGVALVLDRDRGGVGGVEEGRSGVEGDGGDGEVGAVGINDIGSVEFGGG